ncbi:hypothetical protein [Pedobacter gandavensis]|uniref:HNH endonuclease n=1 Tax=Pedobacter gandavensis TaxID=2679963 RepID=A0ABR6F2J4_9SPHI|nr:hypothetical protein [Pedobacter gandavensis]MBB2151437.1 hypothetical protein [Pedobacter gandavensis]
MIKTPLSIEELDALAVEHFENVEKYLRVKNKLVEGLMGLAAPVFTYIIPRIDDFIMGRPAKLEELLAEVEPIANEVKNNYITSNPQLSIVQVRKWFNNIIFQVFNYDYDYGFTKRISGRLAYEHVDKLKLNTCPYCNAQFTFAIKKKGGKKARPHLDHFLDKASHPYFALSFYNLIPSCYTCNSSLKGSDPFRVTSHIHPMLESVESVVKFRTNISDVDFLVHKKDFELEFLYDDSKDPGLKERAETSLGSFLIRDRYKFHKNYASDIITKAHVYSENTVSEIYYDYKSIFSSENEVWDLLMGNILNVDNHHQRILSKMARDIAEEFGIVILPKE